MTDRVPTYPGRVRLVPVSGANDLYDLIPADEPIEDGTPLNKATLLADSTASVLSIGGLADPTVNDAFRKIADFLTIPIHVRGDIGTVATMTKGNVVRTGIVDDSGYAIIQILERGDWTVNATVLGGAYEKTFNVSADGAQYCEPYEVGATLNETSWSDISMISRLGDAQRYFAVGDRKGGEYYIHSFDHDEPTDRNAYGRSKAGITFSFYAPNGMYMEQTNTNANGWRGCYARSYLQSTVFSGMDSTLQNAIVPVKKLTSAGNMSPTIETTSDTLFFLSEVEYNGKTTRSFSGEGTKYSDAYNFSNDAWFRSPSATDKTSYVRLSGGNISTRYASNAVTYTVAFFCI